IFMRTSFRTVPDTNVVIASEKSRTESSPNKEFFARWKNEEFQILYSDDTLLEYIEKMREKNIPDEIIKKMIKSILKLGQYVQIIFYHLPVYPSDSDDIAFLLCAENANATHIITYDEHLREIQPFYFFRVCNTLEFLIELRENLGKKF
ncbi:MAG: PIN domain-containing protein, partial [Desulfobacterales bacterium]